VTAVLFLLRAIVLVLLWGFVIAAIVTVRSDLFSRRPAPAGGPSAPATPARKRPAARSSARQVVVVEGAGAGRTFALGDQPVTIGRGSGATVVVDDTYVSTLHARLVPRGDAWVVEDLGSTNGTFLDGRRVAAPTPVPLGTPLRIGKTVLELRP
jgi:pSer/pThr/pTyr-binding forkhead associated (FHA) protein